MQRFVPITPAWAYMDLANPTIKLQFDHQKRFLSIFSTKNETKTHKST